MELLDCRRLTGPNLLWDRPAVLLDVACTPAQASGLQAALQGEISALHQALGWASPSFALKPRVGGFSLAFSGPIDRLYAGIALAEAAWQRRISSEPAAALEQLLAEISARAAEEANPALLDLELAAGEQRAPFLWDDDAASVGYGASARTWPARELPQPEAVDWHTAQRIPIALITGTNGKTTTARMSASILRAGGHHVGLSSTGGLWLDGQLLDAGDYAGPGGARAILRHAGASAAVLETARGGLLRRGLGVDQADVALITNIAADHLGDFGSRTIEELLEVKWIVSRALGQHGQLVLNADDPRLLQRAAMYPGRILWFSLDADNTRADFRPRKGWLIRDWDGQREPLCRIADIPLCLNGAAAHNIANALAAAAVCSCLGMDASAIAAGLSGMQQDDNPGRGNFYQLGGVRILVDFAHNPAAIRAIAELSRALPARRRLLAFAQAGDRTDELLRECARNGWAMAPQHVIISELAQHARGRAPGEVYRILSDELLHCGCPATAISHVETELEALQQALDWAEDGDLLILLILGEAAEVRARLAELGAVAVPGHSPG